MTIPDYRQVALRLPSKALLEPQNMQHLNTLSSLLNITSSEAVGIVATASAYVVSQARQCDKLVLEPYQLFDDYFPCNNFDGIIEALTNDEGFESIEQYDNVYNAFAKISTGLIEEWRNFSTIIPDEELMVDEISHISKTGEIDVFFHYAPKPFVI